MLVDIHRQHLGREFKAIFFKGCLDLISGISLYSLTIKLCKMAACVCRMSVIGREHKDESFQCDKWWEFCFFLEISGCFESCSETGSRFQNFFTIHSDSSPKLQGSPGFYFILLYQNTNTIIFHSLLLLLDYSNINWAHLICFFFLI